MASRCGKIILIGSKAPGIGTSYKKEVEECEKMLKSEVLIQWLGFR